MQTKSEQLLDVVDRIKNLPPEKLHTILSRLPSDEKAIILELLTELEVRKKRQMASDNFMDFVHAVWPSFIEGKHHVRIARLFEQIASGKITRLIINLPPRHTKSEFASYLFPAWYLGKFPHKKIIQASHTAELAVGFGRKVRNLVDSEDYHNIFRNVALQTDSKAAGRWNTNFGGDYNAIGTLGALAGKGADLCVYSTSYLITKAGGRRAKDVCVGDYVWTERGFREVTHKVATKHQDTYIINKELKVSHNHPIYVFNKGFVSAEDLVCKDMLYTTSIWDKIVSSIIIGVHNAQSILEERSKIFSSHARIQYLGDDASKMPKPECGELYELRWPGHNRVQEVGIFTQFHRRYGVAAIRGTHTRSNRQRGGLRAWELPLGYGRRTAEQEAEQCNSDGLWGNYDSGSVVEEVRPISGHYNASGIHHGNGTRGSFRGATHELGTARGYQESLGWFRNLYIWVFSRSSESPRKLGKYLELLIEKVEKCLGFLVGVRQVADVGVLEGEYGEFYNFTVADTHTFVADTYLTHNCIIDDPISEQEALSGLHNPTVHNRIYEWYTSGPRQRLQPNGAIVIVQTRWSQIDLTGQVLRSAAMRGSNEWTVVEFPAILPSGEPLWPEFWSKESMEAVKAELPTYQWNAQYQQNPTGDNSAIIKREWWKWWEETKPPKCDFIIQSWDTAHETKNVNDYSACTTWGVWYNDEDRGLPNIILLNAFRERLEFPELKKVAFNEWKEWEPDSFLVEKKAAGAPLIQEFRAMGISVQEFSPGKGQDKISRLNAVSDIFASGKVWVPRTRWAEEVVDEVASFPAGEHDDYTDSMTLALSRFRQGGYMQLPSDEPEPIQYFKSNKKSAYY